MLGVPRSSTNLVCYGELGRAPLLIRKVSIVKYWMGVAVEWDTPPLVKEAYLMAQNCSSPWTTNRFWTIQASGLIKLACIDPLCFIAEL